jgi:hypothetical protein
MVPLDLTPSLVRPSLAFSRATRTDRAFTAAELQQKLQHENHSAIAKTHICIGLMFAPDPEPEITIRATSVASVSMLVAPGNRSFTVCTFATDNFAVRCFSETFC